LGGEGYFYGALNSVQGSKRFIGWGSGFYSERGITSGSSFFQSGEFSRWRKTGETARGLVRQCFWAEFGKLFHVEHSSAPPEARHEQPQVSYI
jgi:hypothetical protein